MQRAWSKDVSSWMTRLLPESIHENRKIERVKMFGSKNHSTSKFYMDLEMDVESEGVASEGYDDAGNCQTRSFRRFSALGGFCRFQPLVSASAGPAGGTGEGKEMENSATGTRLRMSRSVLEYGSSGYISTERSLRGCDPGVYAVSESDSEEESEEVKLVEEADAGVNAEHGREPAPKSESKANIAVIDTKRRRARHVAEELLGGSREQSASHVSARDRSAHVLQR
ncbi:hypothetical protein KM043_001016 [Ampulex compressa]|nr:hypothetical protein KM043_001016 [Ampulex compressa]